MTGPRFTPLVNSLPATVPFVGPEALERARGRPFAARLGANESLFGPPPVAVEAMAKAAAELWQYGDPESWDLRAELANIHAVGMENIVMGSGIDGLLGSLVRLCVAPGDAVVTSLGGYPTLNYHVAGYGGVIHTVPFRGDHEDCDALIAKAAEVEAKLVYLANPDNPMGTWHDAAKVQAMIEAVPDGTLLILDEAYLEFAPQGTAPAVNPDDPRVIRMRTFSKAYGMAGARIGYALGAAPVIAEFAKVRNHFGVSRASQAGALAALGATAWLAETKAKVAAGRDRLAGIARANQMTAIRSATNFVTMDCGKDGEFARAVLAALADLDIFVRMPFVAPGDRCIRVSAGPEREMALFEAALPQALKTAHTKA
ncbi:histidinol-phosphate aminotransferase [Actibacterium mucosum KCTC 23349]|uniref:histidinol-phosphate transaminase n=1 Tax=Actibacterium mucosum KCTC 23349 TaxID=1454373 RepID=A0A037ZF40_9RHOB|nr:pyridoxal phosphate-dependent aminotransferase [Actibacterium mucosum]KAJ54151.1 histidinol-phosphate aminotransferase [Actibacterium mucosum KCTC 23349]